MKPRLIAPLGLDADVGQLRVFTAAGPLTTLPLHPLTRVGEGGWWRRMVDSVKLWFRR